MLADPHVKIVDYSQNSSDYFINTDIKGGVAILYRNSLKKQSPINEFIPDQNLRNLSHRFKLKKKDSLSSIMFGGRSDLKFNKLFLETYPDSVEKRLSEIKKKHPTTVSLSPNEEFELKSSTLSILEHVFIEDEPKDISNYYKILGLYNGNRVYRWIEKKYLEPRYSTNNVNKYKVFIPESNGSGKMGEALSSPVIGHPYTSSTPTFISIGSFETEVEAINVKKYISTKFARALLGISKTTQHNPPSKWIYIPLQDFISTSDIDWTQSVADVDKQLYKKYGLTQEEIDFIETNVKEMK